MPVKRVIALRWRLSSFASWGFYIWELWRCAKITKLYTQTHTGWNKRPKAISSGVHSVKEILSHNCSVCFFRCRVGNINERDSWSREHTNNRPWDFFLLIHCKGAFTKQTNLSKVALANTACRMWPSQSWQNAANRFFFTFATATLSSSIDLGVCIHARELVFTNATLQIWVFRVNSL